MAQQVGDTVNTNVVSWPAAIPHLNRCATRDYRLAAKAPTEFERGRFAGRAEMAEELRERAGRVGGVAGGGFLYELLRQQRQL